MARPLRTRLAPPSARDGTTAAKRHRPGALRPRIGGRLARTGAQPGADAGALRLRRPGPVARRRLPGEYAAARADSAATVPDAHGDAAGDAYAHTASAHADAPA